MMHLANDLIDFNWWSLALSEYVLHPLIMIILCLLSVFVVLGNLLVVSAIWHEHQLHSVTNYLIASLAAADCLVGAVVMPFSIISEIVLGSWTFGEAWCDLWHSFDVLASTASIMNLCAISLDRYLAITNPISYPRRMTPKRVALLIVSLWTCSSLISFPAILWWRAVGQGPLQQFMPSSSTTISPFDVPSISLNTTPELDEHKVPQFRCVFTDDPYYLLFSSFISFYGPLCVMLYAYYRIYKAAVQQTRFLKYGSKQVMIGKNKKRKKRSRNISEHSSIGVNEKNKFVDETCDGISNVQSYDRQHLVLRVHRGGGGASSVATKGSISDMASVKGSNNRCRKENQNFESKSFQNVESAENDARDKDMLSSDLNQPKDNCPHLLLKKHTTQSLSSSRNDGIEFINRNTGTSSSKRDKQRVDSQRFDIKQPAENTSIAADRVSIASRENDMDTDNSRRENFTQLKQNCGKPLLAYINQRSTSVDVSIIDNSNSMEHVIHGPKILRISSVRDQCLLSQAKRPANSFQEDSSFIEVEEKENENEDHYHDANNCTNSADFDEDLYDDIAGCDSLSSSSGSYGTGSISSVMVRPELFKKNSVEESKNKFICTTNHKQPSDTKSKRAFSFSEAHGYNNVGPDLRVDDVDNEDVFTSPLDQDFEKTPSSKSKIVYRASCDVASFQNKAAKTLNIRSWVKLTRMRNSSKIERNQTENVLIKPPSSLMPLMMMNSDTSTDSSIVSSVIKQANRKEDRIRETFEQLQSKNYDIINKHQADDTALKLKSEPGEKLTSRDNHHNDKNLTFKEDLERGEKRSSNDGSKGQMLYYNSEKLIQSIVDLSAIHYIDCANQNSKNHEGQNIECKTEIVNEVEKLDLQMQRTNNVPRQQRGVGKKLSKLAKERKAAKTLGIVVGVFILCWLPFFVVNIVVALCGTNCIYKLHIFVPVVTWLGWLNSAMNPVIYACWSRDFRRAFRRVLCTWVEFVCPYDGAYLARKLKLKKSANFSTQDTYLSRAASSIKGNTSSATVRSVGVSIDSRVHNSMNGKAARNLLSDQRLESTP